MELFIVFLLLLLFVVVGIHSLLVDYRLNVLEKILQSHLDFVITILKSATKNLDKSN